MAVYFTIFMIASLLFTPAEALIKRVNYTNSSQVISNDEETNPFNLVTIQLTKKYIPVKQNGVVVMHKTAHFGDINVGLPTPQKFTVVFDTGSGYVFVPSTTCTSKACQHENRNLYDREKSGSLQLNQGPRRQYLSVEYGTGEMTGEIAREVVCLKDHTGDVDRNHPDCSELRVLLAHQLSDEPFNSFDFDGVIGLGLMGLVEHPEYSFFNQMSKMFPGDLQSVFGVFISRNDLVPSEISFGGHDNRRIQSKLKWTPVLYPELGYWQVGIKHVFFGDEAYEACEAGDCVAIVDSGTSLLGVPKALVRDVHYKVARTVTDYTEGTDCRQLPGPDIVFDFGDDLIITLSQDDYSRPAPLKIITQKNLTANESDAELISKYSNVTTYNETQYLCRGLLLPVQEGEDLAPKTWILGEPMFRKYYTTFDWKGKQIGFAPSMQPPPPTEGEETAPILTPTVHYV